jgi:hypothetical protein
MRTSKPKPHQINKLPVFFDSEVRKRTCRTIMRTSAIGTLIRVAHLSLEAEAVGAGCVEDTRDILREVLSKAWGDLDVEETDQGARGEILVKHLVEARRTLQCMSEYASSISSLNGTCGGV